MRKLLGFAILLVPMAVVAQSGMSGTWRINLDSAKMDSKPQVFQLNNGIFSCETCTPKIAIKADGEFHPVTGSPYVDQEKVTVKDNNTIEQEGMKDGKVTFRSTLTVSPDGKTLTQQMDWHPAGSSEAQSAQESYRRVGEQMPGGSAISGSWRIEKLADVSASALTFAYKPTANGMSYRSKTGESYDANFDGADYPYHGDPGTTSVSLKKVGDNKFVETYKRDGKVVGSAEIALSPDGSSLTIVSHNAERGTTDVFTASKSPENQNAMADK